MRYATYSADGTTYYGAVTDDGMIALNDAFPNWPTLYDAVAAGGLADLASAAAGKAVPRTRRVRGKLCLMSIHSLLNSAALSSQARTCMKH